MIITMPSTGVADKVVGFAYGDNEVEIHIR